MRIATFLILLVFLGSCGPSIEELEKYLGNHSTITCNEEGCSGAYYGEEFMKKEDVAHQFSNVMSDSVGSNLKRLYHDGKYSRVLFSKIKMSTKGMGTGKVRYRLEIPFQRVQDSCEAATAFDHAGGWGHTPELKWRKKELLPALLPNDKLDISLLKTTREGLQEYWIQWRHTDVQKKCE